MTEYTRIKDYIDSLCRENRRTLEEIRKEAVRSEVPIIRRDSEQLLKVLLAIGKPEHILEIGTAVGYSAVIMAEYSPAVIDTLEIGEKDYRLALGNIAKAGYEGRIFCHLCDAGEYLKNCTAQYDAVFLDAAKGQYINWLPLIKKVLKKGGMLIADNVLLDGKTIESRYAIDRRDRTEHARMREYLEAVMQDEELVSSVVAVGDGMGVSYRK